MGDIRSFNDDHEAEVGPSPAELLNDLRLLRRRLAELCAAVESQCDALEARGVADPVTRDLARRFRAEFESVVAKADKPPFRYPEVRGPDPLDLDHRLAHLTPAQRRRVRAKLRAHDKLVATVRAYHRDGVLPGSEPR